MRIILKDNEGNYCFSTLLSLKRTGVFSEMHVIYYNDEYINKLWKSKLHEHDWEFVLPEQYILGN